jgi:hypothetical protein
VAVGAAKRSRELIFLFSLASCLASLVQMKKVSGRSRKFDNGCRRKKFPTREKGKKGEQRAEQKARRRRENSTERWCKKLHLE